MFVEYYLTVPKLLHLFNSSVIVHSTSVVQQQQMLSQRIYLLHDVAQQVGSLCEMIGLIL